MLIGWANFGSLSWIGLVAALVSGSNYAVVRAATPSGIALPSVRATIDLMVGQ
jgi:hypothetical protein